MIRQFLAGAAGLGVGLAGAASAAPTTTFTVNGALTAGYSTNPYLADHAVGSATVSIDVDPTLAIASSTSTTLISGQLERVEYLSHYSASRVYGIDLTHEQHFSDALTGTASASFSDATSALLQPFVENSTPVEADIISSAQRVRTYGGAAGLQWQFSEHDNLSVNGSISRGEYPGRRGIVIGGDGIPIFADGLSNYTSYSGTAAYDRTLSAKTDVGFSFTASRTLSGFYPDTTTYQPRLTLRRKLSDYWTFNGSAGLIFENSQIGNRSDNKTTFGFDANLCRQSPRFNACFDATHDVVPSGYGGLRNRWQASATATYNLTEHSRVTGAAGYALDKSSGAFSTPDLDLLTATGTYDHDLTQRIALTGILGYQRRHYEHGSDADGVSASIGIRVILGRRR